ncbi:site-specific integrase [Burkholderia glumae]|uniref:site-specific integrase n=1 Tax=Burkholderia glumae TaxID=337 RepID=UPI0021648B63|nr:site-specific integrase [Burkholderia glumae]
MKLTRESIPLKHRLLDEDGYPVATFDLSELDVSTILAEALLRAHAALHGHTSPETQKQAFRSIRKLILCLQEMQLHHVLPLPPTIAQSFHDWLARTGLKGSTAQSLQNIVVGLLAWCARNAQDAVSADLYAKVISFRRDDPTERRQLDSETVRAVLAACYERITQIQSRLEFGTALIDGTFEDTAENRALAATLLDVLKLGRGQIPTQREVGCAGQNLARRVREVGGLPYLRELGCITVSDIFPFYLSVIVQTGGNPLSIRELQIDCIERHPLRDDLEVLGWEKKRAHHEQRQDFSVGKTWSAPNIIRKIIALNQQMRETCRASQKRYVFIACGKRRNEALLISVQSLHNYLKKFLQEHSFPDFDFEDFRVTQAMKLYGEFFDLGVPQRRLNHKSARTTSRYTSIENFPVQLYRKIAKFQGVLAGGRNSNEVKVELQQCVDTVKAPIDTVFGFACRDPFAGMDGVTPNGTRCLNFTACSTCAGSVVPLDDPKIISRIIAAKLALEEAQKEAAVHGWSERFDVLYRDTLIIINQSILSNVMPEVMKKAQKLARRIEILPIE